MIVVPVIIVFIGFVLTQNNTIVFEERVLAPEGWSIEKVAYKYAPILFQEVAPKNPKWDYICRVDFDNDWDPLNNSNNILGKANLDAAVYYSVIESKSHYFITYSIFHAVDWGFSDGVMKKWYENDIKNLQVVVEKQHPDSMDGEIVFLTLQDGEDFNVYNAARRSFKRNNKPFSEGDIILLNDEGIAGGTHPAIVIEKGRHNIQLVSSGDMRINKRDSRYIVTNGVNYFPALVEKGEVSSPNENVRYALLDMSKVLWERKAKNPDELYTMYKQERFDYYDEVVKMSDIPAYFHGKQLDGYEENVANPNTLPFSFGKGNQVLPWGILFFNPIKAYSMLYDVHNCSLVYTYHPFAEDN